MRRILVHTAAPAVTNAPNVGGAAATTCAAVTAATASLRYFGSDGAAEGGGGGGSGRSHSGGRGGKGRGRGPSRRRLQEGKRGFSNVDRGAPLRDARLDGLSHDRYNPNRNLTYSVQDEIRAARGAHIRRDTILTGALRDNRLSDVIIDKREQAKAFRQGTVVSDADPDGKYKPSHRPRRLTMPVDFDDLNSYRRRKGGDTAHGMHNKGYAESIGDPNAVETRIPSSRDRGGRAAAAIRATERRSANDEYDAAGHSVAAADGAAESNSGFATSSASYTSSGMYDYRTQGTERTHRGRFASGALAAGEVPEERSVADCFRFLLDNCKNLGVLGSTSTVGESPFACGQGGGGRKKQWGGVANSKNSVLARIHEGGTPVFDPIALPAAHLLQALQRYEAAVLRPMAEMLEAATTGSGNNATAALSADDLRLLRDAAAKVSAGGEAPSYLSSILNTGRDTSIAALGNESARGTVLPNAAKRTLSRAEALALLRDGRVSNTATTSSVTATESSPASAASSSASASASLATASSDASPPLAPSAEEAYKGYLAVYQKEQQLYRLWDLMAATPLNSPNNGAASHRGRAFAMHYLTHELIHSAFPNCRGRLAQSLLHKSLLSPLAIINASNELGLTTFTNYETEVGLYRESITLFSTLRHTASTLAAFHRERFLRRNIEANKYSRTQQLQRSVHKRLAALPTDPDTLHLRVKWLEDLLFSFVDFVRQGEGDAAARRVIDHYFAPALARHQYRRAVVEESLATMDRVGRLLDTIAAKCGVSPKKLTPTVSVSSSSSHSSHSENTTASLAARRAGTSLLASTIVSSSADVLHTLRDCIVDVLVIGDGCDEHGSKSASEGIQRQQMLMRRHIAACGDLVAQMGISREGFEESAAAFNDTFSSSSIRRNNKSDDAKASSEAADAEDAFAVNLLASEGFSLHNEVARSIADLDATISADPRTNLWDEANSNVAAGAGSSVPSMATRALDAILRYHPRKEEAHAEALIRSTSSGAYGTSPWMVEAGGSGLLLDAQGNDEEVAAVAMQLSLDGLKGSRFAFGGGSAASASSSSESTIGPQTAALRQFVASAFLPPSTVTATANSRIAKPLNELQLLLKYSPHVLLGGGAGEGGSTDAVEAPGARSYTLHVDVRKETGSFEDSGFTIAAKGVQRNQQQFYTATLYLYHYAKKEEGGDGGSTIKKGAADSNGGGQRAPSSDVDVCTTVDGAATGGDNSGSAAAAEDIPVGLNSPSTKSRIVKRHVLGSAIGINIESATHAATMRVLKRFYYKGGSSAQWQHAAANL